MESPISSALTSPASSPSGSPERYCYSSRTTKSVNSSPITKEDVLKKFLDSKNKSPTRNEPGRTISPPVTKPKSEESLNKNIIHGVHIPPKMLAHSLRKKENKYFFYYSTVSKFEGNIRDIPLSARKPESSFVNNHQTSNIEELMASTCSFVSPTTANSMY